MSTEAGQAPAVSIDGTKVPVYCEKDRGGVPVKEREAHPDWLHHPEAMAGFHVREGNHAGFQDDGTTPVTTKQLKDKAWAFELHLATACQSVNSKGPVPRIALGMAFDSPAGRIGENSLTALMSATQVCGDLGVKPDVVVADRAILPNSRYEKFQQPARAAGWDFCMDYRDDQLSVVTAENGSTPKRKAGAKAAANAKARAEARAAGRRKALADLQGTEDNLRGAIMHRGEILCPGTPQHLLDAEKNYRDGAIDKPTRDALNEELRLYPLTRKEKWSADGVGRFSCPATTPGGKLSCPLRDLIEGKDGALVDNPLNDQDRERVENPPAHPGEICTTHQASLQLKLDSNTGKYAQRYPHRSPNWHTQWGQRNTAEGFNAMLKEEDHEALDIGKRRRVRGLAKQALLVSCMVFSGNVRSLRAFMHAYAKALEPQPTDPGPEHPNGPHSGTRLAATEDLPPPDRHAA